MFEAEISDGGKKGSETTGAHKINLKLKVNCGYGAR